MKITTKTTKEQLKSILGANASAVKKQDNNLYDRIVYASKMCKEDDSKVLRKDLADLVKEVIKLLGDKIVDPTVTKATPVAENSVKKLTKGANKKQKSEEEPVPEVEESEETPAKEEKAEKVDKKSAKKSLGKKKESKKDGVIALEGNSKTIQMAKQFPQTLDIDGSKYELASDIKTMEDLYTALEGDEPQTIVFAYYWTERHLKQFSYFNGWLGHPKSFPNDLDLTTVLYVSDEHKVCYQVSSYTDALYAVFPAELEEFEGIRYAGNIEYQIYREV